LHSIFQVAQQLPVCTMELLFWYEKYFVVPIFLWLHSSSGPRPPHCWGFEITLRHTAPGTTPLDEWSVCHMDLYFTTHNTHITKTFMHPVRFEPAVPASEQLQTHTLGRVLLPIVQCVSEQYIFMNTDKIIRTWHSLFRESWYNFYKMTNEMQLCRTIYCSLIALHVSSDIFVHHHQHLKCTYSFWFYSRVSLSADVMTAADSDTRE
jgi:hypothetical protein